MRQGSKKPELRTTVSRQRRAQLRNRREGKCAGCGLPNPRKDREYCDPCRLARNVSQREKIRLKRKSKRRALGCESYAFERELRKLSKASDTGQKNWAPQPMAATPNCSPQNKNIYSRRRTRKAIKMDKNLSRLHAAYCKATASI